MAVEHGRGLSLDEAAFKSIAKLPGREVLNGQLAGVVASPLTGLVRGLGSMIQGLALQLGQIAEKGLVSGEAPAAEEPKAEEAPAEEPKAEAEDAPAEESAPEEKKADEAEVEDAPTEAASGNEPPADQAEAPDVETSNEDSNEEEG